MRSMRGLVVIGMFAGTMLAVGCTKEVKIYWANYQNEPANVRIGYGTAFDEAMSPTQFPVEPGGEKYQQRLKFSTNDLPVTVTWSIPKLNWSSSFQITDKTEDKLYMYIFPTKVEGPLNSKSQGSYQFEANTENSRQETGIKADK